MKKGTFSLLLTLVAGSAASPVEHNLKRASALVTTHVHSAEETRVASSAPPVVRHDKVAGNGYKPGSPLYAKQEALKASGELKASHGASGGVPTGWKGWLKQWKANLFYGAIADLIEILIVCLFAFLYRKYYTRPPVQQLNATDGKFQHFLFDCSCAPGDMVICCMSLTLPCCLPIRWSETVSHSNMTGYGLSFWPALLTTLVLGSLHYFTGGFSGLVFLALAVYYRQQLRKAYDYERSTKILCVDCLTWWCCPCCAAVQEAREVEKVRPKAAQTRDGQVDLPGDRDVGARKEDARVSRLQANRLGVGGPVGLRRGAQ